MKMYCRNCGSELPDSVRFCPACGAAVSDGQGIVKEKTPANMVTWKLISGIMSFIIAAIVLYQTQLLGIVGVFSEDAATSSVSGLFVAILLIAVGIVSIAARKKRGSNITIMILSILGALIGFGMAGIYEDLMVWSSWFVVLFVFAFISMIRWKKKN